MIKEVLLSFCMMFPQVCNIKNNIQITPLTLNEPNIEMSVKKRGVLKKEYRGGTHFPVVISLGGRNLSEKPISFKLSNIHFYDHKGSLMQLYLNIPTHVLDRGIEINPGQVIDLDLYIISNDLDEKIRFAGIER